jgi:phage terminase large subunit-like protein
VAGLAGEEAVEGLMPLERREGGSLRALIRLNQEVEAYLAAAQEAPFKFFEPNPMQLPFKKGAGRNRWIFAGNKAGKTYANAHECACFAMGWHPFRGVIETPNIGWVISPDSLLSKEIMEPPIREFLGDHNIKSWSVKDRTMVLRNGSVIVFKSADAGVIKFTGRNIRWAAIDEDCPEDIYKETLMRTFQSKGDIWGTITPLYSSWMYRQIFQNQFADPEVQCFFGSTYDNAAHLPLEEIERIRRTYSKEELEARLYGKFLKFSGLIYKEFTVKRHVIEPHVVPKEWQRFRFIDHGLSDECACLWVAVTPDAKIVAYREYYKAGRTIQQNAEAIRDMSGDERYVRQWIDWSTNRRTGVGGARPSKSLTLYREWMDAGIKPLSLWPRVEVQTKINKVQQALLDDRLKVFRGLVNLCSEFTNWGRTKSGEPEKGGDHLLDCIGAACLVPLHGTAHEETEAYETPVQGPVEYPPEEAPVSDPWEAGHLTSPEH